MSMLRRLGKNVRAAATAAAQQDPDAIFADVSQRGYDKYEREFKPFELDVLARAQSDTSLVDAVPEDTAEQQQIAEGIARRNRERFGFESTAALASERERATQRGSALNLAGGLNNARLAQLDANQRVISDLINIGQGVNRSSLSGLGTAAENAVARRSQYERDRTAYKNSQTSMLTTIASAAIIFSDINLKEDIKFSHKEGDYNIYTWEWSEEAKKLSKGKLPTYGVLAQEVQKQKPEAVITHGSGYLMVDYGKL
jgi:hypothetical protein